MSDSRKKFSALLLSVLMVLSIVASTAAFTGAVAAATNTSISPSDDDASASGVTYTADGNVELDNQDSLVFVDVHLGPADISSVGSGDVQVFVDGNEYTDGLTEFSASDGTVEFKLQNSRSVSDGDRVRVVVHDVTNPDDDFSANTTLHDSGDAQWQEYTDTVAIDTPPSISYSDLSVDDRSIDIGEDVTASATVENTGEQTGVYSASLKVDGSVVEWNNGTIAGETTKTVDFVTNFDSADSHDVTIKNLAAVEVTVSGEVGIDGGSADPSTVSPDSTVSDQEISVVVRDVSQDGNTDTHYVEFPNALADGLSVNSASANAASITSSPNIVDGSDDDGVAETVKFATSGDGGGDIDLELTVDASVTYPDTEDTYGIDARVEDSDGGVTTDDSLATITAKTSKTPIITDFSATNPADRDIEVAFNSSEELSAISVDVADESGSTVATLAESDFTGTNESGTWVYEATHTVADDDEYTATLTEAADADGNDGADGETSTVVVDTTPVTIADGSATPATVSPGETVSNQEVQIVVDDVSADGDTDTHYVEFPNALADGLSVNSASANATSITSSAELVEGFDNDRVVDTVKFATSGDGGGDRPLALTVDVSASYPSGSGTYSVDARVVDSTGIADEATGVTTIEATTQDSDTDDSDTDTDTGGSDTTAPDITDFSATNPSDRTVPVTVRSSEALASMTVEVTNAEGDIVARLHKRSFEESVEVTNPVGGEFVYEATYTAPNDGNFTATLTEATDDASNDGAAGESETVAISTPLVTIVDGSATPATVSPGETVSNQEVQIVVDDVSADGDTDIHYVEFPNALAGNLSVNSASANATSITSSAKLVDGYDDDGVADTVRFATSADGSGDVALALTVDASVAYANESATYDISARTVDSASGTATRHNATSITTGTVNETMPGVERFDLVSQNRDVDLVVTTTEPVDELQADIGGSVGANLTRASFSVSQEGGVYTYTADVVNGTTGTFNATLEAAANEAGDAANGQTDSLTVLAAQGDTAAAADPPWVGATDSSHTVAVRVPDGASVVGETLQEVTIDYSTSYVEEGGSLGSVSDDQNVDTLIVVGADGSVKSRMSGTDAVSVTVVDGEIRLDVSDVDSERKPTLAPGDRVIVDVQPVTNPGAVGDYGVVVGLDSAADSSQTAATSVAVLNRSDAKAIGTDVFGPNNERARFDLDGLETVESVGIGTEMNTTGLVSVAVPGEMPPAVDAAPGSVVSAFNVSRPDPVEDSRVALNVTLDADELEAAPDSVVLARYDAEQDRWVSLDTEVVSQSDGVVTVAANASETSLFAVPSVNDESSTPAPGTDAPTTTTDGGTDAPTTAICGGTDALTTIACGTGPGLAIAVAVAALLAAAILAFRRRD